MMYKTGDILISKDGIRNKYWRVREVIYTYKDSSDDYYWVKTLSYETDDESVPTYMDICVGEELDDMRKIKKGEYEEIIARVL